ncbi:SDR family oxidoreductase [Jiulongibacter sediminis]|jgi:short-subunit dehydrogenase|uniref:SDR family oxidoreductase n=1 Tax=Jiulongibacter sediminis TaxID=1605367 RepID=UPI0026F2AE77|nr:SDR family oxidoreductase [Jiulongibacter sediminis]
MSKSAVITGATKGIGRAIAIRFAQEGFDLALTSRTEADLSALKKELEAQFNIKCVVFAADLSNKADTEAFVAEVKNTFDNVNVLVNNTGIFVQGALMTEPEGALEKQIDTNLYSAYYTTRGLIETIRKGKGAHIFNICSIASLQAYPGSGSYSISKFALLGFSKSLREELKPEGIKVTSIMPGATFTSSWEGIDLPESRFISAKDVADTVWASYNLSPSALIEEIVMRPLEGDI